MIGILRKMTGWLLSFTRWYSLADERQRDRKVATVRALAARTKIDARRALADYERMHQ